MLALKCSLWYTLGWSVLDIFLSVICEASICGSPQHLEMGKTGIIRCSFSERFEFVLWYNSTFTEREKPIVYYQDGRKGGPALTTREFDITSDGSLVINNVSLHHEHKFTAAYALTGGPDVIMTTISVFITVSPVIWYPVINNDRGNAGRLSFRLVYKPLVVCSIDNVRPAIPLIWLIRTKQGDKIEPYTSQTLTNGNITYSTTAFTENIFVYSDHLSLLACKADGPPGMPREESLILVQNGNMDFGSIGYITKYVKLGSMLELNCSENLMSFLVWEKFTLFKKLEQVVLYAVLSLGNITKINIDEYQMGSSGSLIFLEMTVHNEGLYRCISSNGVDDSVSAYEVFAYENPVPPHPVVDGCESSQYCNLPAGFTGHLTCTMKQIRPKVELKFVTFDENDSALITFSHEQQSVKDNGETFDVFISTTYRVEDTSLEELAVECRVSGLHKNIFNTTGVKVYLQFEKAERDVHTFWKTLVLFLVLFNIFFLLIFACYSCRQRLNGNFPNFGAKKDNQHDRVA